MTSDGEGTRHQRLLDQIKELHERFALLRRAYDALSERLSDQRLAIAESWEEREKEWGEKLRLSEAEREMLTANLARAASDAAARSDALTESERRVAGLLEEAASLRAQLAAEATRRSAAETEMRRISEEAAALRAELEQLRPDHEQLAKFHGMVLAEVDALLNDKQVLVSRLAEVEAERDAARQNAERVSAAQAAQLAQVRAEYDVLHFEFVRFTSLRLFRYTAPLRATYAALRRLLGLKSG